MRLRGFVGWVSF